MVCVLYDKTYRAECNDCGAAIGVHWGNKKNLDPNIVRIRNVNSNVVRALYHGSDKVKPSEWDIVARRLAIKKWNTRAQSWKALCEEAYAWFKDFVHLHCPDANLFFEDVFDDDHDNKEEKL